MKMRYKMKTLILSVLLLFVSFPARAQFSEVTKFPYNLYNNQSNAKILDLGNNHFIFIMANDSLFVSHSYDNGSSWQTPIVLWAGSLIQQLDGIVLPTGRIILEFRMSSIYSDDNGITWSEPVDIGSFPSAREKKLYYSGQLYAFMGGSNNLYYWSSQNDGINWSTSYATINNIAPFGVKDFSFINFSQGNYFVALMGKENGTYYIILKKTTSFYNDWEDIGTVFETTKQITDIDGIKDSTGKYWISFTMVDTIGQREVKNVYYITSEDDGNTWSDPVLFARSFQDDWNIRLSISDDNPYAVFLTNRDNIQATPYYGKLGVSLDENYPPFLEDYSTHIVDDYPNVVTVFASARAYTDHTPLTVSLTYNGEPLAEMFDDGQHNDGVAGDSIFGISYVFNYSEIGNDAYPIGLSATDANQATANLELFLLNPPAPNDSNVYVMRQANTRFAFKSNGVISKVDDSSSPQTTYDGIPVIYSAGFLMSGYYDQILWANGIASSSRIEDYVGGTIEDTSKVFYVIKSSDPPFGESWQNWRNAVAKGAYFYDGDGDGVYNPIDLNGNGQWDENEDCPDILGDETVWFVYNDGVPSEERQFYNVFPLGIEVRQTVWTKYNDDLTKNVYYVRYSIVNKDAFFDTLKNVYFGVWADNDIGNYTDDLTGCSINTSTGYTYNADDDEQFGESAPVAMVTLLQGPIRYTGNPDDEATNNMGDLLGVRRISGAVNDSVTSFVHYMQSHPTQGDPDNEEQARYYLLGLNQAGELVDPCSWEFGVVLGEDCSNIDGHFMYSGDPIAQFGWINTFPTDQRQMLNTGPFDLVLEQPIDIIVAYHFSKGETSLQSIALGLEKAQELLNNFRPNDVDDRNGNNLADKFELKQNYPNPFNPTTTISYVIPNVETQNFASLQIVTLKVYDILGREVATLVNKKQTPGKYSVQFNGRSLASGVYFYTLQAGNFIQTRKMILLK